jgi:ATP-dependent helicase Lhr and Lhr-like helicase
VAARKRTAADTAIAPAMELFAARGWKAFDFQVDVWRAYLDGRSGLIHSATGTGKTLAAWLGPLLESFELEAGSAESRLKVLWLTPLRALAADTVNALRLAASDLGADWRIEARTSDTSSYTKAKQSKEMPEALVTTPESLSILLSRLEGREQFSALRCVIVDEWHELMSSKRGVQTELALARLRSFQPSLRTWGLSATLGNLEESLRTLMGVGGDGVLVRGDIPKSIVIDSLLPPTIERFPWAGQIGTQMIPLVVEELEATGTTLIFCSTRAHTEIWYKGILSLRPDWEKQIALHHGSLDREERDLVEEGLRVGKWRAVICTSSLDLGVDFSPVDRVLQIGSPKGVARLLQRAGRSGHRPGVPSRVTCVPTYALELIDNAAARDAAAERKIEARGATHLPLDVLAQHLVTIAAGEGFIEEELKAEVRTTRAYEDLSEAEWSWCLDFVSKGGTALKAYPEYRKIGLANGRYLAADKNIAVRHRASIGTIVSEASMTVQYLKGSKLGTIEENFLTRLRPGDKFVFAGKVLEFIKIRDMTAWVRRASSPEGAVPKWSGMRLPISDKLAPAIREKLDDAKNGLLESQEMRLLGPLLEVQAKWSAIPGADELLIERVQTREGHHLFFYPVEGRLVHEGLAALFAYRISRLGPITFSLAMNDYGFELLAREPARLEEALEDGLLSPLNLENDIRQSLNSVEMARRQFREIARIAGLIFEGTPGRRKSVGQLQASSGLIYDVFLKYDPDNMLLHQANKEVLERQLEESRMFLALERLNRSHLLLKECKRPTPFAFPILVDRLREKLSTESVKERIESMALQLEKAAG